ncbi:MAG: glutamine amidotransferase [Candidatus Brocadiia bacterium]
MKIRCVGDFALFTLFVAVVWLSRVASAGGQMRPLPPPKWDGPRYEIKGLEGKKVCTVGYPEKESGTLQFRSEKAFSPGLYRLKLRIRPSHVSDAIAWNGALKVRCRTGMVLTPSSWRGFRFARENEPEVKTVDIVLNRETPLEIELVASIGADVFAQAEARKQVKDGAVTPDATLLGDEDEESADVGLTLKLDRAASFYYVLEQAEIQSVSPTAYVKEVNVDKVRYESGDKLKGEVDIVAFNAGARGKLQLFFEHGVQNRTLAKEIDLKLDQGSRRVSVELPLPDRKLGHALVARFIPAEGALAYENAEYFNIADNFYRVAIHFGNPIHRQTFRSEEAMRGGIEKAVRSYANCREIFFWAEEDMVEMSPESDYWFSGQTTYHMSKEGLKRWIDIAHEYGVGVATYGKFIMSGYLGWKTAYDHPFYHKKQYSFPLGMWEGVNVAALDRFKNKEFAGSPPVTEGLFGRNYAGLPFMPINPDPVPHNVRRAAEEVNRSIEMFGWDGIRWDGHPKGAGSWGNSCGGVRNKKYSYTGHRKTQTLVRYFKDIVASKHPGSQHGYNYLHTQGEPFYEWAYEDFELQELCRGGGLLMNESIRKSHGHTFEWMARNLQVEGDLARERGGLLLGISCDHVSDRDTFIESILWFAAGCRPYSGAGENRILNRYATRFSKYVFDETMTRLAGPGKVLRPAQKTQLWWTPFVYETRRHGESSQLVVNLLNLPRKDKVGEKSEPLRLCPGTDPFAFQTTLPESYRVSAAHLIDPFTLRRTEIGLRGKRLEIPSVAIWRVLVLDLKSDEESPTLGELFGPPRTVGVKRENLKVERRRPLTLDPEASEEEVYHAWKKRFPGPENLWWEEKKKYREMSAEKRNQALCEVRKPIEHYLKSYPYGVKLPADLKMKEDPPEFGNMAPLRNGITDIFYGRGAMDYRWGLYGAFAHVDRVRIHEARLKCPHGGKRFDLRENVSARELPRYDVLCYADLPHAAIGVRQSYALVPYVRAGGGVLFLGGEYSFGKGRYAHTVLDRKILPVISIRPRDNRYVREALHLEPGKDFGELGVECDFSAEPAFWAWNEVALRPDSNVKVFLKAGNRPILVGWQKGEGRVACLMAMHRGHSNPEATAFFEWNDWPSLLGAVLRWLSPKASVVREREVDFDRSKIADLKDELEGDVMEDLMGVGDEDSGDGGLTLGGTDGGSEESSRTAKALSQQELAARVSLLRKLLKRDDPEILGLVADQLAMVGNLPDELRFSMALAACRLKTDMLEQKARQCVQKTDLTIRGYGYMLLAASGSEDFPELFDEQGNAPEIDPAKRRRYLAMAVPFYPEKDLMAEARDRIESWNRTEQKVKRRYTGGEGFSMAAPEVPCLDSESLFRRVGWLAYAARWDTEEYAAQFAREWAMLGQYRDLCDRTSSNLWEALAQGPSGPDDRARVRRRTAELRRFKALLCQLQRATRPRLDSVLEARPELVARGLAGGRFLKEVKQTINLLGDIPAGEALPILRIVREAEQPLLAGFAQTRLKEAGP